MSLPRTSLSIASPSLSHTPSVSPDDRTHGAQLYGHPSFWGHAVQGNNDSSSQGSSRTSSAEDGAGQRHGIRNLSTISVPGITYGYSEDEGTGPYTPITHLNTLPFSNGALPNNDHRPVPPHGSLITSKLSDCQPHAQLQMQSSNLVSSYDSRRTSYPAKFIDTYRGYTPYLGSQSLKVDEEAYQQDQHQHFTAPVMPTIPVDYPTHQTYRSTQLGAGATASASLRRHSLDVGTTAGPIYPNYNESSPHLSPRNRSPRSLRALTSSLLPNPHNQWTSSPHSIPSEIPEEADATTGVYLQPQRDMYGRRSSTSALDTIAEQPLRPDFVPDTPFEPIWSDEDKHHHLHHYHHHQQQQLALINGPMEQTSPVYAQAHRGVQRGSEIKKARNASNSYSPYPIPPVRDYPKSILGYEGV